MISTCFAEYSESVSRSIEPAASSMALLSADVAAIPSSLYSLIASSPWLLLLLPPPPPLSLSLLPLLSLPPLPPPLNEPPLNEPPLNEPSLAPLGSFSSLKSRLSMPMTPPEGPPTTLAGSGCPESTSYSPTKSPGCAVFLCAKPCSTEP